MARHQLGLVPSPIDDRDKKLVGDDDALFGTSIITPPKEHLDLLLLIHGVNDQSITNSCVWNALQTQHHIVQRKQGVRNPKLMSRLFGYFHTRKRTGDEKRDLGCIPREAWKAAAGMGFCTEELWPFDPAEVNAPPDFDATAGAIDQQWVRGYYNIWGLLHGRDEEVKMAISKGHPVVFGSLVDDHFDSYSTRDTSDTLGIPRSVPIGRHMMCAPAYDEKGLWVVNSWGLGWGGPDPTGTFPGGFFRMSWEWVNWHQALDWWAVEFAKEFAA